METELKAIANAGNIPDDLTIIYDDLHGLWGGTTITVRGNGSLERRTSSMGSAVAVSQKTVDRPKLIKLVQLVVEQEAWQQHTPDQQPVADESRAYLTLSVHGKTSRVWERVNDMTANDRLIHLKTYLEAL